MKGIIIYYVILVRVIKVIEGFITLFLNLNKNDTDQKLCKIKFLFEKTHFF